MKKFLLSLLLVCSAQSFIYSQSPTVQSAINQINIDSLIYFVKELSGEVQTIIGGSPYTIVSRNKYQPSNDKAADYVKQKFQGYGLTAYDQWFSSTGRNVYGVQTGTEFPNKKYIICAHYDDMPSGSLAPGADDNGSGTAGVVEAARVLTKFNSKYTIVFAVFDEEEQGLVGSAYFASQAHTAGDSILGVINMDMIAWDGDQDGVGEIHIQNYGNSLALKDTMVHVNTMYTIGITTAVQNPGTTASDQASFWNNGYGALLLIEEYYGGDFNAYYHTVNDKLLYYNQPYFLKMSKLAIGTVAQLAKIQPATFPLSVSVDAGWNVVSIPGLLPTNQNIASWWPGSDPSANVFRFVNGYEAVFTASPGAGYWMKNLTAQTYNTGDEWPAGGIQLVSHSPIPAAAGWNMIGGYDQTVNTSGLTTTPPGLITGTIYKYTPGSGYQAATQLVPGYGYWVKLTGAGSINIPAGAEKGIVSAVNIPESFGKITLTDNKGNSNTLYAVDSKTELSQFDLPPYPPQGMFDIRYSSQRYAERIKAPQIIEMMGVEYPVKIKTEETSIIISDETGKEIARLKAGEEVTIGSGSGKLMVSDNVIPAVYALEQNYPNPFNPSTMIQFSIPEDVQSVKLIVYSALGEKVAELVNTGLTAGIYKVNWNAGNIASGLYIYQIVTNKYVSTKKMMLLK